MQREPELVEAQVDGSRAWEIRTVEGVTVYVVEEYRPVQAGAVVGNCPRFEQDELQNPGVETLRWEQGSRQDRGSPMELNLMAALQWTCLAGCSCPVLV